MVRHRQVLALAVVLILAVANPVWAQGFFTRIDCPAGIPPPQRVTNQTFCGQGTDGGLYVWNGVTFVLIASGSGAGITGTGTAPNLTRWLSPTSVTDYAGAVCASGQVVHSISPAGGVTCLPLSSAGDLTAKYIVQQPAGDLPNAQALSALGTALLLNTTGTGVLSAYGGSVCPGGQFAISVSATGVVTCAAAAGGGTVTGTGVAKQIAVWDSPTSIAGYTDFIWDEVKNNLDVGFTVSDTGAGSNIILGHDNTTDGSDTYILGPINTGIGGGGSVILGFQNIFSGAGTSFVLGDQNDITGCGSCTAVGIQNTLANTGTNVALGNFNIVSGGGSGFAVGTSNTDNSGGGTNIFGTFNADNGGGGSTLIGVGNTNTNSNTMLVGYGLSSTVDAALQMGVSNTPEITITANLVDLSAATDLQYEKFATGGAAECLQVGTTGLVTSTGAPCGGAGSSPGGVDTNVQFNDGGSFGGNAGFTFDKATERVIISNPNIVTYDAPLFIHSDPASSTNPEVSGLKVDVSGSPANPNPATGDFVAIYSRIESDANRHRIWGANFVTDIPVGLGGGGAAWGIEVDINNIVADAAPYGSFGQNLGVDIASGGTKHPTTAIATTATSLANRWQHGIVFTGIGGTSGASIMEVSSAGQPVSVDYGIDLRNATIGSSALRLPNNANISWRNFADSGDIRGVYVSVGNNLILGTDTNDVVSNTVGAFVVSDFVGDTAGRLVFFERPTAHNPAAPNFIRLHAPDSLAASWTCTLPPDHGTAGQLLTTDGATPCQLSWGPPSAIDVSLNYDWTGLHTWNKQAAITLKPFGIAAGQTGEIRWRELAANGTNFVGFKAPDSITVDTVWTLPALDGPAGSCLATSGTKILGFANCSGTPGGTNGQSQFNSSGGFGGDNIFHVKAFPNGPNTRLQIQNAITAAPAGSIVQLDCVNYALDGTPISIPKALTLRGCGINGLGANITTITTLTGAVNQTSITVASTDGVVISDLSILQSGTSTGIEVNGVVGSPGLGCTVGNPNRGSVFSNLEVVNGKVGISIVSGTQFNIYSSRFYGQGGANSYGVRVQNTFCPDSGDSSIVGSWFEGGATAGVFYQSGGGLKMIGNGILELIDGVIVQPPLGITLNEFTFVGNKIGTNGQHLILLDNSQGGNIFTAIIGSNILDGQAQDCIALNGDALTLRMSGVTITGNQCTIRGGTGSGIVGLGLVERVMISGNIFDGVFSSGVAISLAPGITETDVGVNQITRWGTNVIGGSGARFSLTTPVTFAQMNAAVMLDGSTVYCSNCTIANPCNSGGTGAIAKRLNGVYVCN